MYEYCQVGATLLLNGAILGCTLRGWLWYTCISIHPDVQSSLSLLPMDALILRSASKPGQEGRLPQIRTPLKLWIKMWARGQIWDTFSLFLSQFYLQNLNWSCVYVWAESVLSVWVICGSCPPSLLCYIQYQFPSFVTILHLKFKFKLC